MDDLEVVISNSKNSVVAQFDRELCSSNSLDAAGLPFFLTFPYFKLEKLNCFEWLNQISITRVIPGG